MKPRNRSAARALALAVAAGAMLALAAVASADPWAKEPRVLRVGIFEAPPFVMKSPAGAWEGISVDLWRESARELHLQYVLVERPPDALLAGVAGGTLDVVIAPVVVTPQRQRVMDFSLTYFTSGLAIATPRRSEADRWVDTMRAFLSVGFLQVVLSLLALWLLAGYAIWLLERRKNPTQFGGGPWTGIGEGFWWASVTFTGVGYGDKVPRTVGGRAVALIWMVVSVMTISGFTAALTARLAVSHFEQVRTVEDLRRYRVATVAGTSGEEYLRGQRLRLQLYPTVTAAIDAVARREVEAMIYGEATLRYLAPRTPGGAIEVLPDVIQPLYYAFALPPDSALRTPVNQALVRITSEALWRDIRYRYLGE